MCTWSINTQVNTGICCLDVWRPFGGKGILFTQEVYIGVVIARLKSAYSVHNAGQAGNGVSSGHRFVDVVIRSHG